MIVVDASVLVPALVDGDERGDCARARIGGEILRAPELIDLEVLSALRGLVAATKVSVTTAERALALFEALPLQRSPHAPLRARAWKLRPNLTPYDASYVVLAELLGVALVTADARLAGASGLQCEVEILAVAG